MIPHYTLTDITGGAWQAVTLLWSLGWPTQVVVGLLVVVLVAEGVMCTLEGK